MVCSTHDDLEARGLAGDVGYFDRVGGRAEDRSALLDQGLPTARVHRASYAERIALAGRSFHLGFDGEFNLARGGDLGDGDLPGEGGGLT
ncbi:MAG: hypothetical protein ACYTFT_10745 [Planctomycetota bacterium]|jgi:hypothetical protein